MPRQSTILAVSALLALAPTVAAQAPDARVEIAGAASATLDAGNATTLPLAVTLHLENFACAEDVQVTLQIAVASGPRLATSLDAASLSVTVPSGLHASWSGTADVNLTVEASEEAAGATHEANVTASFPPGMPEGCQGVSDFPAASASHLVNVTVPVAPEENGTAPPGNETAPPGNESPPDTPLPTNGTDQDELPTDPADPEARRWYDVPGMTPLLVLSALVVAGAIAGLVLRRR